MASRSKILLVALETDWPAPARVPQALQAAGFEVGVACRAEAFLAHTKYRDHFFRLPEKNYGRALVAALRTIVSAWPPDCILPMDDQTALFLTRVHERLAAEGESAGLTALLRHSLGNPDSTRAALSKRRTMETAHQLGIRVPASQTVASAKEAIRFGRQRAFPVVLKRSFGCGGYGIFICRNEMEINRVFGKLRQENRLKTRLMFWRERVRGRLMNSTWLPADRTIIVNQFIRGKCATSLVAAARGETLAALTAEVEQTYLDANGPASVVRLVRNEEMCRVSATMVKHWGLTGLIGFDFILDESGQPWLLECNPRPTPLSHLGTRVGEDLCTALLRGLTSTPFTRPRTPKELMVAHFPQEMWRAPDSPYFKVAFHDVPADDPALLEVLKRTPPQRRSQA